MNERWGKKIGVIAVASIAGVEHLGLLWFAAKVGLLQQEESGEIPVGLLVALALGIAVGLSLVSAGLLYGWSKSRVEMSADRDLWTFGTMAVAPWIGWLLFLCGAWMGVLALFGPFIAATAPYLLVALFLSVSRRCS
jgi:hypothetical protein